MKKPFFFFMGVLLLLSLGFIAGRIFQNVKNGYHYEVREEKTYPSKTGDIHWRYVTESVGLPFLDPGTTILEFNGRIIYKAKRGFQESVPFAQVIKTGDNIVEWEDGEYHFRLNIEPIEKKAASSSASGTAEGTEQ